MPSSISSFKFRKRPVSKSAVVGLLVLLACLVIGMEALTRFALPRYSGFHQRFDGERKLALSKLKGHESTPTVLMVGNSLLLEGVNFGDMKRSLATDIDAYRYLIIQTNFYDWYYGLDRLFKEGVRPNYVLYGMSPRQLTTNAIRGDYSAHYLFDMPGIVEYARQEKLTPTQTSTLAFANLSELYATRSEIRTTLLERFLPRYGAAMQKVAMSANGPDNPAAIAKVGAQHLALMKELCEQYGAKLIFVLPPAMTPMADAIRSAGADAKVQVLVPAPHLSGDRIQFAEDAVHLNGISRPVFTAALARELLIAIGKLPPNPEHMLLGGEASQVSAARNAPQ